MTFRRFGDGTFGSGTFGGALAFGAAASGSGTLKAAHSDAAPLLCSDVDLMCSDLTDCADSGAVAATTKTGTLVPA